MRSLRLVPLTTLLLLGGSLMSCSLWQTNPEPCNCSVAETELRELALKYGDSLESVGNLRQQLKACTEKR